MKGRIRSGAAVIIARMAAALGVTLAIVLLFLLGAMWVVAHGPSPAAGRLFALSVRETSAVGFLANIYFTQEEIDSFYHTDEAPSEATDTSLISVKPQDTQQDETQDDKIGLPQKYEGEKADGDDTDDPADSDGIELIDITGASYRGKLMIVADPSRIIVGTPDSFGADSKGLSVVNMIAKYGAVAGINAGGFADEGGGGTGGIPDGMVMADGELLWGELDATYNIIGFDADNILHVGRMTGRAAVDAGVCDAVCFGPALIINGKPCNSSWKLGGGLNPRTAIGQRADGSVLLLVINGRQIDSLGATYDDLIDIMLEYGAVNASNLDGGSSSLMIYNGEYITNSAYIFGERVIATSFLVK